MELKDLAKSEYYDVLVEDFTEDLSIYLKPDNIPEDDLANVKAHKKLMRYIQDKIEILRKLRKSSDVVEPEDSYE